MNSSIAFKGGYLQRNDKVTDIKMSRDPGTAVGDPQHCSQSARVKKTCPAEIVEKETNAGPHTTQITELNPETWRHSTGGKLTQMTMQKNPAAEKLPEPSGT